MPDDALGEYFEFLRLQGLSELTVRARRGALDRLARQLAVPLLEASADDLLAWRKGMTVGPVSVRSYVSHVQQFYAWAARRGLLPASPAAGIPVPKIGRRLPRPIGTDDLFAAVAQAPDRIRLWLVLAAWCGLRAKEIALLRRECILLTSAPPMLLVATGATKGIHERMIPLSRFALAEIAAAGLPPSGWCFLRHDGRPGPNRPAHVSALANVFLRDCGIEATLHMLRHWFGTEAYATDHDLRMVQELLGHRSVQSTQGYADWNRSAAVSTVQKLPVPPLLRVVGGKDLPAPALGGPVLDEPDPVLVVLGDIGQPLEHRVDAAVAAAAAPYQAQHGAQQHAQRDEDPGPRRGHDSGILNVPPTFVVAISAGSWIRTRPAVAVPAPSTRTQPAAAPEVTVPL